MQKRKNASAATVCKHQRRDNAHKEKEKNGTNKCMMTVALNSDGRKEDARHWKLLAALLWGGKATGRAAKREQRSGNHHWQIMVKEAPPDSG